MNSLGLRTVTPSRERFGKWRVLPVTKMAPAESPSSARQTVPPKTLTSHMSEAPRAPARGICGEAKRNCAEATRRRKAMAR